MNFAHLIYHLNHCVDIARVLFPFCLSRPKWRRIVRRGKEARTEEAMLSRYFVGFVCSTQSVVSHRSLPSRLARERFQSNSDFSSFKRHASIPNIIYIMPGVARIYLVAKLCASGRVARFSRRMYESCELIEIVVAGLVSPFVFVHF